MTFRANPHPVLLAMVGLIAGLAGLNALAQPADAKLKRLIASPKACPGQNMTSAPTGVQEKAMRCLINQARKRSGLPRLRRSRKLDRSAGHKSRDIKRCNSFDHYACGRDFAYWFKRTGFAAGCWSAAENIAWGERRKGSPRKIFAAWLRSPGHRDNILEPSHRWQGVGLRKGPFLGTSQAQVWTSHFGRRC